LSIAVAILVDMGDVIPESLGALTRDQTRVVTRRQALAAYLERRDHRHPGPNRAEAGAAATRLGLVTDLG
jgi:hypothetical protein